ncbi:hypothetical protein C0993_002090 [Termitomyces sp. T159_Od127]|nr:hypothetical protein C0993_002090 [Termitomyces sp. T159_Od127]
MTNSSHIADEGDEVYHVGTQRRTYNRARTVQIYSPLEVITKARVAPPSDDEDEEGQASKRKKKGKSKGLKKPKWWAGYDSEHNSWEPEENVAGCQRLLASFWAHVGTDDNDYDIGYEVTADEKWIKKEKRFFSKEYNAAEEERLRKQREKDESNRKKKTSLAMSDEDSDDLPLIAKRKREVAIEISDDDISLVKAPVRKKARPNSSVVDINTRPNKPSGQQVVASEDNWAASLFSSPEPEATLAPRPLPTPAPLPAPLPPVSQHFASKTKVHGAVPQKTTATSSLLTKNKISSGALALVPPKAIPRPASKVKNQPALPRSSTSTSFMPLNFKKSTSLTSTMIPNSPVVEDAQVSISRPMQAIPTTSSVVLSPNLEHLDGKRFVLHSLRLPEPSASSHNPHNPHMDAADVFLREIMPSALAGPLKPAEEQPFEPQPPRGLVSNPTPVPRKSQPPWTWSGNVFIEADPSKPLFSIILFPVFLDDLTVGHIIFFNHTTRIVSSRLKPPSEVQTAGSIVAALVPWILSPGQLSRHHRYPANRNLPAQAEMEPLVRDETQWMLTVRVKPGYHHGLRLLKFPRSLHAYLSDDGHERTFSVWFEGGDGVRKKPGLETIVLFKILEKCRTKHSRIRDARIIFIHVGALEYLEKLPGLLEISSSYFSVQFYTYGTHESIAPEFWGIREIYPCGGIVTFSPQALLDDPIGVQHRISQFHSHPMWECYILPSVLGMVAKLYCQNDPIADFDSGKFPYTRLLRAIDEGELAFISSPSSYGLQSAFSPQEEWVKRHWTHRPRGPRAILQASLDAFHEKYAKFGSMERESGILDDISKDLRCMRRQPVIMGKYRRYVVIHSPRVQQRSCEDALEWTSVAKFDFKDDFFPLQS